MPNSEYTGEEKRRQGRTLADVEAAFDRKLQDHEVRERAAAQSVIEALKAEAFPDGPQKHAEYHQAKINTAKEEAEFWRAAKAELTKVGIKALTGVIKTVLLLALAGLLYKIGLGGLVGVVAPK